jgi:hypothetical protein
MIRVILVIALVWLALLPPFFTNGACTAEFNHVSGEITDNRKWLASPELAEAFWRGRNVPVQAISYEECHRSRPRFVDDCGQGELLYVAVPIQDRVCRIYRDSAVRVQLKYDDQNRLRELQTDMKPFKYLRIPWSGVTFFGGSRE